VFFDRRTITMHANQSVLDGAEMNPPTSLLLERLAQARAMGGNVLANYALRLEGEMLEAFYKQMAELQAQRRHLDNKPAH
jgi:hypothetical protein